MLKDLCKYGFMSNYTRWVCHGEAYRPREEAVRQRLEAFDGDGGVAGWLGDYEDAAFAESHKSRDKSRENTRYVCVLLLILNHLSTLQGPPFPYMLVLISIE
jgi:hypothetical protein